MKKCIDDVSYYEDFKSDMESFWDGMKKNGDFKNVKSFETTYLYLNADLQDDEHDRLCVVLPLIKLEIEHNMLSKELLGELEIYYEDFNKGVLDDELYENEYEEIKSDLYWCYENRNKS